MCTPTGKCVISVKCNPEKSYKYFVTAVFKDNKRSNLTRKWRTVHGKYPNRLWFVVVGIISLIFLIVVPYQFYKNSCFKIFENHKTSAMKPKYQYFVYKGNTNHDGTRNKYDDDCATVSLYIETRVCTLLHEIPNVGIFSFICIVHLHGCYIVKDFLLVLMPTLKIAS